MKRYSMVARVTSLVEMIASRNSILSEIYALPYREVVAREIALAGISSDDQVLSVGCGPVPFTAIHLARQSHAEVIAIDYQPDVVAAAKACIRRLGLSDQIRVICMDAALDLPEGFDAAIVALQAHPKEDILEILQKRGAPEARFIFRAPSPQFTSRYDALPGKEGISAWVEQRMKTFDRSILYTGGQL